MAASCGSPVPCAHCSWTSSHLLPCRLPGGSHMGKPQEGHPPAWRQGVGAQPYLLICEEEGSAALPTPDAPSSQGGVSALSPLGGQGIAARPYLQTKSSVKKTPENATVTLDYFLECVTLSCPQPQCMLHRYADKCALTLPPTLSHTHPSLGGMRWGTGLSGAVPSSGAEPVPAVEPGGRAAAPSSAGAKFRSAPGTWS